MAIAFVNRAENTVSSSGVGSVSTAAESHTSGNLLVVGVSVQSATSITVTDTAGNTFNDTGLFVTGGTNRIRLYYADNITGHASNQVTAALTSGTAAYFTIGVLQFSGFSTTDALESTAQANSTGSTSIATVALPTRASDAVVVAMIAGQGTYTGGSGFTLVTFGGAPGAFFATEYQIVSAATAATATQASGSWGAVAGMFSVYPTAGGSGGGAFAFVG
jgi:hypothetical protein